MSLTSRIRTGLNNNFSLGTGTSLLRGSLTSSSTYAGKEVTVERSLALVPVFAAVERKSSTLGSSPLIVYRDDGKKRERAIDTLQWSFLHDAPNDELAADEFWALVCAHLDLWGNAYLFKIRDGKDQVTGFWCINPARVKVGRDQAGGVKLFALDGDNERPLSSREILHIRGLSSDGLLGYSRIQVARQMLGSAMAMDEFQGSFWKNGANPGVVLEHPGKLGGDALKQLKASWKALHGGPSKAGETAILEEGMTINRLTMPLDDAQFIEQHRFTDARVAQLFGMPPSSIGAKTGDSLTYSTVEGNAIDLVRSAVRPVAVRIESSLRRDPDVYPITPKIYAKFSLDAAVRADIRTRYQAHMIGIKAGFLTINEARELEDLNPLEEEPMPAPAPIPEPDPTADPTGDEQ